METWILAWRNLWRNRRRTMITLVAVAANTAVLIVLLSFNEGVMYNALNSITRVTVGDAQMHAPKYRSHRSFYNTIKNADSIVSQARKLGYKAAPRSFGFGLLAFGTKSAGAAFWGVDPAAEKATFDLPDKVTQGNYLNPSTAMGAVLGKRLAKTLQVEVGDEFVVLVQAADGSMGNDLLKVSGILKGVGDAIDRNAIFIRQEDFDALFVSSGMIHEIAFTTQNEQELKTVVDNIQSLAPKMEVQSWKEILSSFADMIDMSAQFAVFFGLIFALAAGLGVMNTMLMATHDRVREFGVLKALGASAKRILIGIACEAILLSAIASLAGAVIGALASIYLQEYGLDLSAYAADGIDFNGVVIDSVYRAKLYPRHLFIAISMMTIICPLASLYPAIKAARLDPVIAMHHV
jgi:ABC-type lipoprotein release transport system permease subunit